MIRSVLDYIRWPVHEEIVNLEYDNVVLVDRNDRRAKFLVDRGRHCGGQRGVGMSELSAYMLVQIRVI